MAHLILVLVAFAAGLWLSPASGRTPIEGPVTAVHDGDTLRIGRHVIRLANIDAPELAQEGGSQARAALVQVCAGQWARAEVVTVDRYSRMVATVMCGDIDAGRALVAAGWAWVYRQYNRDPGLMAVERRARSERMGIWANGPQTPPWTWRSGQRG